MKYLELTISCLKDVFRGEWGFITMMAPERIPGMMRSMLQDYVEVLNFCHILRFMLSIVERAEKPADCQCGKTLPRPTSW